MSDHIRIKGLEVFAHIGVPDEERATLQKLLVNLELYVESFANAAANDDLSNTVDYSDVVLKVRALTLNHPRKLIEALAEDIAGFVLRTYPVRCVSVEVEKFILPGVQCVAVSITRSAS
ncbi:MAG: dihydroneopterin aldolase [Candidatus Methylacidiphilales bacterium]